jgi:cytochrome c peroxidase
MRALRYVVIAGLFATGFFLITNAQEKINEKELLNQAKNYFKPLPKEIPSPPDNPLTKEKVELGKKLYYEPRLSLSGIISCNTCHNLAIYGTDLVETSLGHKFQTGGKNSPTVLNAGFHVAQFWDGRAKDLEEQAKGPILNPVEMAMPNPELVVERLKSIDSYVVEFKKAFPGDKNPVNFDNVAKAIAAFERTLTTPSRFDDFLKGNTKALNSKEKEGLKLFIDKGCVSCHYGIALGGEMFATFGVVRPYPYQDPKDLGRFNVTKNEDDKYVYKVPSLRNVTQTYPYFHDGKVWDLREAIKIMGDTELGITLTEEEIDKIVMFLDSTTGKIPEEALKVPVLPPSSPGTPKPRL